MLCAAAGLLVRLLVLQSAISMTLVVAVVAGNAVPPPLNDTPPVPENSSPVVEVIKTYPLPNPEEVAVDPTATFFVSGTNDGYVSKVDLATGKSEQIFGPKDFRPGFFANATNEEIRSICDGSDLVKERNCGRIFGVKFEIDPTTSNCKSIWMANAYFGIFEGSCTEPWTLERKVSIKGGFVNDIQPHGRYLYYTITHSRKQHNQLPYVVLDDTAPGGSLHRLDISSNNNNGNYNPEELARDIYFANGLAVSTDGLSIYVSETTAARIQRYDIQSGLLQPFLEDIPVLTDNIIVQDGDLLVPGYTRNAAMEALLKNTTALNEFLARGPQVVVPAFQAMVAPDGNLLIYDEATGTLKKRIFQNSASGNFSFASSAHRLPGNNSGSYLVGSVFVPVATWFTVAPNDNTAAPTNAPTDSTHPTCSPTSETSTPTFPPTEPASSSPTYATLNPTSVKSVTIEPTELPTEGAPPPPGSDATDDEVISDDSDSTNNEEEEIPSSSSPEKVYPGYRLKAFVGTSAAVNAVVLLFTTL